MHVDAAEPRSPALDGALQTLGQGGVGGVHVGEHRVATLGRNFDRVEERSGVRDPLVLAIGMPAESDAARAERLAVAFLVGDHHHLRVIGQVEFALHDVQRTQPPRERDVLRRVHVKVAEHEKAVIEPGLTDAVEIGVGQTRGTDPRR